MAGDDDDFGSDFLNEDSFIQPFSIDGPMDEGDKSSMQGGMHGEGMRSPISGVTGWGVNQSKGSTKLGYNPFLEAIVRPFVTLDSAPQPAEVRIPIPGEETEAFIIWGKESNFFETAMPTDPIVGANLGPPGAEVKISDKDKDKDKENQTDRPIKLTEELRSGEIVKIKNPDNEEQWVKVERIKRLLMRHGENGRLYDFEYHPPRNDDIEVVGTFVHTSGYDYDSTASPISS